MNLSSLDTIGPADLALFLDFDGTLAPIAEHPLAVQVHAGIVPTLASLARTLDGAIAIISGRPLTEIDRFLAPLELPAAGVHGAEIRDAHGKVTRQDVSVPAALVRAVEALAFRHPALLVENKGTALALHYRARPDLGSACESAVRAAIASEPGWSVLSGKCVVEVKPRGVSKGKAIALLLGQPQFAARRPVFLGDDVTDEDGFAEVQSLGGLGIKVGPGDTCAQARITDTTAVDRFLAALAERLARLRRIDQA